jgi:hypothetical protein
LCIIPLTIRIQIPRLSIRGVSTGAIKVFKSSEFVTIRTHIKLTCWFSIINIQEQFIAHWFTWIPGTQQYLFACRVVPNIIWGYVLNALVEAQIHLRPMRLILLSSPPVNEAQIHQSFRFWFQWVLVHSDFIVVVPIPLIMLREPLLRYHLVDKLEQNKKECECWYILKV